jgi:hypothetical protein
MGGGAQSYNREDGNTSEGSGGPVMFSDIPLCSMSFVYGAHCEPGAAGKEYQERFSTNLPEWGLIQLFASELECSRSTRGLSVCLGNGWLKWFRQSFYLA